MNFSPMFEIFDSSSFFLYNLNFWPSLGLIMLGGRFWMSATMLRTLRKSTISSMNLELSAIFKNNFSGAQFYFVSLFMMIFFMNTFSLIPYTFSANSHLSVSLFFALPIWFGPQLFSWMLNFKNTLAHLVPMGTPLILIPLLVFIELISNIIRPVTLSIRLTANITAGHLILSLISSYFTIWHWDLFFLVLSFMCILELGVAIIQAFVFSLLTALYTEESLM